MSAPLTAARLRELLTYEPRTGKMRWRADVSYRVKAGDEAGAISPTGHVVIKIDQRTYFLHRLAVLHVTGHWPNGGVAHDDYDLTNNRWDNLIIGRRPRRPSGDLRILKMLTTPKKPAPPPSLWNCWKPERELEMA